MRGITFHEVSTYIEDGLLKRFGVESVIMVNDKTGDRSPRLVKLIFESESAKDAALKERFISLDCRRYYLETPGRGPTQCNKCHKFGHIERDCQSEAVCSSCGENHTRGQCMSGVKACVNCGGRHSALWRGCASYKQACEAKQTIRPDPGSGGAFGGPRPGFYRNYSQAPSSSSASSYRQQLGNQNNSMESIIASEMEKVRDHLRSDLESIIESSLKTAVVSVKQDLVASIKADIKDEIIGDISNMMKDQSERTAHFIIDCFKILRGAIIKSLEADAIAKHFNRHQLGALSLVNFSKYCERKLEIIRDNSEVSAAAKPNAPSQQQPHKNNSKQT